MPDKTFLTTEEVYAKYRGSVSVGTLRNWRAMKIGPTFVKIGKATAVGRMSSRFTSVG
jgi:hypothetical protein